MTEHISHDCKYKLNSTTCNSKQKRSNKTCQCEYKSGHKCEKDYTWNRSTCICGNEKYLKSVADTSVTEYHEVIIVMDNVSTRKAITIVTKKANTIVTNMTSTASISYHSKKVGDCCILYTVLLVIILLYNFYCLLLLYKTKRKI